MFQPGNPGRPVGSLNKRTQLMKKLGEEFGEDWITEMKRIALDSTHKDQMRALEILGKKMFPDLKAVEVSGEVETTSTTLDTSKLSTDELVALKKALQK